MGLDPSRIGGYGSAPMAPRPPLLALKDVRLADGSLSLFEGVELALEPGAKACLVGRNGAGKSTLLKILAGKITPDSGERVMPPGTRIALVDQEPQITGETLSAYAEAGGAEHYEADAALEAWVAEEEEDEASRVEVLSKAAVAVVGGGGGGAAVAAAAAVATAAAA